MEKYYIKSMTAFGRDAVDFPYGRFTIEIQSVNRRYLEINIGLPRLFGRFEMEIRKQIAEGIGRGMLTVSVSWKSEGTQPVSIMPNLALARAFKGAWERLASELGLQESLPVALLAQEKDLFLYEEEMVNEELYKKALSKALRGALAALLAMKWEEGNSLAVDLIERLTTLRKEIQQIAAASQGAPEKYRIKLKERLQELFSGTQENEERILREIALYAERLDITEEIIRFKGHLDQFENLLTKPLEHELEIRGKTLDFLIQELLREVNTIGSKASDLTVAQHVVTVKSELEKIREQVQNIE